jgi:hypothetical protein
MSVPYFYSSTLQKKKRRIFERCREHQTVVGHRLYKQLTNMLNVYFATTVCKFDQISNLDTLGGRSLNQPADYLFNLPQNPVVQMSSVTGSVLKPQLSKYRRMSFVVSCVIMRDQRSPLCRWQRGRSYYLIAICLFCDVDVTCPICR